MNTKTFGADLRGENSNGGRITITDDMFYWHPILGGTPITIPIMEVTSYYKNGTTLVIYVNGLPEPYTFYTWKAQSIIDAIKIRNPYFNEVPKGGTSTPFKIFDTLSQLLWFGLGIAFVGFIAYIVINIIIKNA